MPHHRTLSATMDWSYGLLGREERTLFGRLSVFAGSFALDAAEAVGSGEGIEEEKVLDLLSSLVDKSLVLVVERDDETRYRLLETVRQYATEKLEEAREAERIRRRHAEHYLARAEGAEAGLKGSAQTTWLRRLAADHDNLRAALWWSLESEGEEPEDRRAELGLRLVVTLWLFWNIYGSSEGLRWVEAALARSSGRTLVRAKALNGAGWMALWHGDHEKGVSLLEEALSLFEELGDRDSAAVSLAYLGMTALRQGDAGRAMALREEAETLIREPLERRSLAEVHFFLAAASMGGDYERGVASFEESRALFRELQDTRGATRCSTSLGMLAVTFDDYERAAVWLEEGLRALGELKDQPGIAFSLLGVAAVADSRGETARAARLWGAAEALREAIGLSLGDYERAAYGYEERLAVARAVLDETTWDDEWSEGRAMTPERAVEYALESPPTLEKETTPTDYPAGLSAREVEVLRLLAQGMTNAQIAKELFISPRTVNAHLTSAYHKIGSHSRTEAARFASEHGLLL